MDGPGSAVPPLPEIAAPAATFGTALKTPRDFPIATINSPIRRGDIALRRIYESMRHCRQKSNADVHYARKPLWERFAEIQQQAVGRPAPNWLRFHPSLWPARTMIHSCRSAAMGSIRDARHAGK